MISGRGLAALEGACYCYLCVPHPPVQVCNADEHSTVDRIIDAKVLLAGSVDKKTVLSMS